MVVYKGETVIKRLREEWLYWRYRNITRRRQLLQARLRTRLRRQPSVSRAFRARGTAMYTTQGARNGRGLLFVAVVSLVLTVVNIFLVTSLWLDLALIAGMGYAYIKLGRV
jgi:hypothetical protein